MRTLDTEFRAAPSEIVGGRVSCTQIQQVWVREPGLEGCRLVITVLEMLNSAAKVERGTAHFDGQVILGYSVTYSEFVPSTQTLWRLEYVIRGLKKVRDYAVKLVRHEG